MFKLMKKAALGGDKSGSLSAKFGTMSLKPPQESSPQKEQQQQQNANSTSTLVASKESLSSAFSSENLAAASRPTTASSTTSTQNASAAGAVSNPAGGLLIIKILEARLNNLPAGFKIEDGKLPYAVVEFDKNEAVVPSKECSRDRQVLQWQQKTHFDVGRDNDVVVSVYQRGSGSDDQLLGVCRLEPQWIDQKVQDDWYKLIPINGMTPLDARGTTSATPIGEIHIQLTFKKASKSTASLTMEDFELLKVIGKGSFGKVMQVRKKDTGRIYAMKTIKKSHIVERDEVSHTMAERNVLAKINHPFIVPIKFSFQSKEKLYLVLAFVNGGELFHHLQQEGRFEQDRAKFYAAELLCALECLHSYNIVYR